MWVGVETNNTEPFHPGTPNQESLLTSVQSSHVKDAAYFIAVSVTSSWDWTQEELVTDNNHEQKHTIGKCSQVNYRTGNGKRG